MKIQVAVAVVSLLLLFSGCQRHLKPGEHQYMRGQGTLRAVEKAPQDQVVTAAFEAMRSLKLRPIQTERDGFHALLVGESTHGILAQSHTVRVWVNRMGEEQTEIKMHIVGRRDKDRLEVLLAEIKKRIEAGSTG